MFGKTLITTIVLTLLALAGFSQTVIGKTINITQTLYMRTRRIDSISIDGTFTNNSDNVLVTQKAIKTYLTSTYQPRIFWSLAPNSANYIITTANAVRLADLTGATNRNVVLPTSPTISQQNLIIKNTNTSLFQWSFTGATVRDMADNPVSVLNNSTTYVLSWDGTQYNIIN